LVAGGDEVIGIGKLVDVVGISVVVGAQSVISVTVGDGSLSRDMPEIFVG
jgi:hypothetical protein